MKTANVRLKQYQQLQPLIKQPNILRKARKAMKGNEGLEGGLLCYDQFQGTSKNQSGMEVWGKGHQHLYIKSLIYNPFTNKQTPARCLEKLPMLLFRGTP